MAVVWRILPEHIKVRYALEFTQSDGGAHRFEIWKSALEKFKRASFLRKLLGFGANSIWHLTPFNNVAHNLVIEFLLEYGVIGTIVLLWMLGYYIKLAYKTNKEYVVAAFIGYIVMMMSLSLYSYKPIWNILLFTILMTKVVITKDDKTEIKKSPHNLYKK